MGGIQSTYAVGNLSPRPSSGRFIQKGNIATTDKWKKYGIWLLSGCLTTIFLLAGGFKLARAEAMVSNFHRFGLPLILMYITGFLEVVFAVGLWISKFRGLGKNLIFRDKITLFTGLQTISLRQLEKKTVTVETHSIARHNSTLPVASSGGWMF